MIPRFDFVRPQTVSDAFEAFERTGGDAAWLAGGTELLQVMKMGLGQFGTLIDVKRLPDLAGIGPVSDGWLRIGALATHREIERSPLVRQHLPGLAELASGVANVRVRNTGTIGGNLAFAEPHSDPATFLLACGARVELLGPAGRRELAIGDFVLGPLFTAREADELLAGIRVPVGGVGSGCAYRKLAFFERPAASLAVRMTVAGGEIAEAVVAVGSMTEVPAIVPDAGAAITGTEADPDALAGPLRPAAEAFAGLDVVADLNGSPDYKRHLAGVLLGRAAHAALAEALVNA